MALSSSSGSGSSNGASVGVRRGHDRETEFFKKEQDKIRFSEERLAECQSLTDNMMDILETFEEKLVSLETVMLPIHRLTQGLTTAHRNIDQAIAETDRVIAHYNVANEPELDIARRNISTDYKAYLDWVESLRSALAYFSHNSAFKNIEITKRKLLSSVKHAMENCCAEFERLISPHSKGIEIGKVPWPFPAGFDLVPPSVVARLSMIAQRMQSMGFMHHLKFLQDHRSAGFKLTMKVIIHQSINTYMKDGELAVCNTVVGRYRKGSHPAIFLMDVFIKLCEMERKLWNNVLVKAPEEDFNRHYNGMLEEPLEYFIRKMDLNIKEKSANKVLILLDILETSNDYTSRFRTVMEQPKFAKILELRNQATIACKRAIVEYRDYVLGFEEKKARTPGSRDGTVAPLTVETLTFLRHLHEYDDIIDGMGHNSSFGGDDDTKGSVMTQLTVMILQSLNKNLEQQAKTYKGLPALASLFLLNNFHHIRNTVVKERLMQEKWWLDKYELLLKSTAADYRSATWDKARLFINMDEAKELHAKCVPDRPVPSSVKKAIKAKFKGFNTVVRETYQTQQRYFVPDSDLRGQLRSANVELILQNYRDFLALFTSLEFSTKPGKYIRYPVKTLESMLNKFFDEEQ